MCEGCGCEKQTPYTKVGARKGMGWHIHADGSVHRHAHDPGHGHHHDSTAPIADHRDQTVRVAESGDAAGPPLNEKTS